MARDGLGAAVAGWGNLRLHSRIPTTSNEMARHAKSKIIAVRIRAGTLSITTLRGTGSDEGSAWGCEGDSTSLGSKTR